MKKELRNQIASAIMNCANAVTQSGPSNVVMPVNVSTKVEGPEDPTAHIGLQERRRKAFVQEHEPAHLCVAIEQEKTSIFDTMFNSDVERWTLDHTELSIGQTTNRNSNSNTVFQEQHQEQGVHAQGGSASFAHCNLKRLTPQKNSLSSSKLIL